MSYKNIKCLEQWVILCDFGCIFSFFNSFEFEQTFN